MSVMDRCLRSAIGNAVVMVCLAVSIAGCAYARSRAAPAAALTASEPDVQSIPPDVRSSDSVEVLLRYGALLRSIRGESLEQEYAQAAGLLADDSSAPNRIRLAMLLSFPGASFQDNTRAREYLELVRDDAGYNAREYHALARFLLAMLDDRKQLESALAGERRQRQKLRQKLEQLKAIERDTGSRIPPKPMKEH